MSKNHAAEFPLSKNPEIEGNSSEFTVQGSLKNVLQSGKGCTYLRQSFLSMSCTPGHQRLHKVNYDSIPAK